MAENEKEAYLALIAAQDPDIRALLDQGFAVRHKCLQGGHGAIWHEGQDGSRTHAKTATGRVSGRSEHRV